MTRHYLFRIVFSVAALAVLGAYIFGPPDLAKRFDTMALGLLGLAALPWLGALVEEFKVGGVEAKLRAIREEVAEAGDAATSAREVIEEIAISRLIPADYDPAKPIPTAFVPPNVSPVLVPDEPGLDFFSSDMTDTSPLPPDPELEDETPASQFSAPSAPQRNASLSALEAIARTYVETRQAMKSSPARTAKMTTIFAEMQTAAAKLGGDNADMLQWMRSDDAGRQLAATSWLRSFPAAAPPSAYVDLIERAKQPFVQYWGLRTLSARLSAMGMEEFSIADRINLKEFESLMRAGTDRHAQIRRINRKLAGRTPAD